MNSQRFAEIYEGLTSKEAALFGVKKDQYAFDDERLHNFIQAALVEGRRPSQVAFSYFIKHLISIQKAIETENYELYWERITPAGDKDECIVQRFADARNYLLLMLCCLEHESDQPVSFGTKPYFKPSVMSFDEMDQMLRDVYGPELGKYLDKPGTLRRLVFPDTLGDPAQIKPVEIGDFPPGIEITCGDTTQYDTVPEECD